MKNKIKPQYLTLIITLLIFSALFGISSIKFEGFFSMSVIMNLFIDNAFLLITALGMTFVLIIGGIDLSVGAVIALVCMLSASLLQKNISPFIVIPIVIAAGGAIGFAHGMFIQYMKLEPFIVTLAGMYFARGLTYIINGDTIIIDNEFYSKISQISLPFLGESFINVNVILAFIMLGISIYIAHFTKFGRNVYAIGGNEQSAKMMGLPVAKTKIMVYTLSGIYSGIAGVVFSFYMLSGYGLHANGVEMDAIASAVIGGTLLTGGIGMMAGTFFGVMIYGLIQTIIMFDGTLSSWWTKIALGALLCIFIVIQRLLVMKRSRA
ncbi:MAG: sugar ABC transporter permease YjfF [Fusobacteriaceae bacterium]|nr:sugar ABC transporter permease YjfF [Fusobacteriaceae bacterium]MBN2838249.1 sugar ABC transporter permease YjfF [Fusobacteriaceae bacterium]